MPERLFLNNNRLNRKAKQFLLQEKQEANPAYLYCLQLAVWGLDHGGLRVDERVEESLKVMLLWKPQVVMELLEWVDPRNPKGRLDLTNGQKDPLSLAWEVLDRLNDVLSPKLGLTREPTRD